MHWPLHSVYCDLAGDHTRVDRTALVTAQDYLDYVGNCIRAYLAGEIKSDKLKDVVVVCDEYYARHHKMYEVDTRIGSGVYYGLKTEVCVNEAIGRFYDEKATVGNILDSAYFQNICENLIRAGVYCQRSTMHQEHWEIIAELYRLVRDCENVALAMTACLDTQLQYHQALAVARTVMFYVNKIRTTYYIGSARVAYYMQRVYVPPVVLDALSAVCEHHVQDILDYAYVKKDDEEIVDRVGHCFANLIPSSSVTVELRIAGALNGVTAPCGGDRGGDSTPPKSRTIVRKVVRLV